jgi:hypothetical protein
MFTALETYLWWAAFVVTAWLIPCSVGAYLCYPARMRLKSVREAVSRTETALKENRDYDDDDRDEVLKALARYRQRMEARVHERFLESTYVLPLGLLALVLTVGFFVSFSRIHPLMAHSEAFNQLLAQIDPGILSGFLGGTLYALYSVVTRYRSQDIPSPLVLQLAYQVTLATAIGAFAPRPWFAFAAGFVPYGEITSWLRHTAQTWFGAAGWLGHGGGGRAESALWSQRLEALQGMAPVHRERLAEEGIVTIENLALANPLALYLATSYSMPQIIDWIDQAYLRLYVSDQAAVQLAARGILGGIELTEAAEQLDAMTSDEERRALLDSLAGAVGIDRAGMGSLLKRIQDDSQVELLSVMWSEFGTT